MNPLSNSSAVVTFPVFSPLDGTKIGDAPSMSLDEARSRLRRARTAQQAWGRMSHAQRRAPLKAFLDQLDAHREELASLLTAESGKTRFEAHLFEVAAVLHLGDYFLANAPRILKHRAISISLFKNRTSYLHYKPRGVVLVISPWNFPLANSLGETLMSLIAGNAVLLKPASLTPLTALRLRELADAAGLDKDLFQVITGSGRLASDLIEHEQVDFVSFTGSTETGRKVAELCGRRLIPCTLELGGKAPALVLEDADLDVACPSVVWGAFANSGQICASIERVLVHQSRYDEFVRRVTEIAASLRQGDPRKENTDIGAMTDPRQIDIVDALVQDAVTRGAKVLTGGVRNPGDAPYYPPTVLTDVAADMRVMHEESFGPLMPVMKVRDDEEAIAVANDTQYGLMASVYSEDRAHARKVAERIMAGTVIINDALATHGFPETPWQGVKDSGMGRVHSDDGLRDLCHCLHVNDEVFRMENPLWYPYSGAKLRRMQSLLTAARPGALLSRARSALRFLAGET